MIENELYIGGVSASTMEFTSEMSFWIRESAKKKKSGHMRLNVDDESRCLRKESRWRSNTSNSSKYLLPTSPRIMWLTYVHRF